MDESFCYAVGKICPDLEDCISVNLVAFTHSIVPVGEKEIVRHDNVVFFTPESCEDCDCGVKEIGSTCGADSLVVLCENTVSIAVVTADTKSEFAEAESACVMTVE